MKRFGIMKMYKYDVHENSASYINIEDGDKKYPDKKKEIIYIVRGPIYGTFCKNIFGVAEFKKIQSAEKCADYLSENFKEIEELVKSFSRLHPFCK